MSVAYLSVANNGLSAVSSHVTGIDTSVESGIKGTLGNVLRGIDTGLDINAAGAVNLLMEHGSGMRMLDVLNVVGDVGTEISGIAEGGETGTDEGSEDASPDGSSYRPRGRPSTSCADAGSRPRPCICHTVSC